MLNSSTRDIINTTKSLNVNNLFFECGDGCCRTK